MRDGLSLTGTLLAILLLQTALFNRVSTGAEADGSRHYIVTVQATALFVSEEGKPEVLQKLPCCSVFETVAPSRKHQALTTEYWPIIAPQYESNHCFIPRLHAFDLREMQRRVRNVVPDGFDPKDFSTDRSIPAVIRLSDARLLESWKELAPVIIWNDRQPFDKRLPEPYFAQGQIWTAVGSHNDALESFLQAAALVRQTNKGNLLEYARYFTILEAAVKREHDLPGKPLIAGARVYWGLGISAFRNGNLDDAIIEFSDAVRLEPEDPLYWFSRSLVYKVLGMEDRAVRDARIGVAAEARLLERNKTTTYVYRDLEIFQGSHRIWLEKLRRGDHRAWRSE